tara:strand:- start:5 stop:931 length:927 start_codon:yes stop_codon:yes gene_type:complete
MVHIIPRDKVRHLEWKPGQEVPPGPNFSRPSTPPRTPNPSISFTIDNILNNGKHFYNADKDSDNNYIGVAVALKQALEFASENNGSIASLPYLIAGKSKSDNDNYLWKDWFTALTEENIGIDKKGKFVSAGKPVVVTVHSGGILTHERIMRAYKEGLTEQNAAKYTEDEFNNLLEGRLPSGESISLYTLDDIKNNNIPDPFARYGIVLDFETAKSKSSGYHSKSDFMNNELVIARAGTLDYLDEYFEKAKRSQGKVGNWHKLNEIDHNQPQGRVLFLSDRCYGLVGNFSLDFNGLFVVVAPEAHDAKK